MENLEKYAQTVASIVEEKENHQRKLGKISFEVSEMYGLPAVESLANLAQEIVGRPVSKNSLLNYRWTYYKTKDLNLPDDLTYQALSTIAGSDDPEGWAKRVLSEGLSSREVYHFIMEERDKGKKNVFCKACGQRLKHRIRRKKV